MKQNDYTLSAQTLFDFICGHFGLDWNEVMNRQHISGTLGSVQIQHSLFDMYKYIKAGEGFLAWEKGICMIESIINECGKLKTPDELRRHAKFLYDAAGFMDDYNTIRLDDQKDWLDKLRSMRLLTPEEKQQEDLVDKCPRSLNENVFKAFTDKRLMRLGRYKGNKSLCLEKVSSVNIGENFILANNVGDFIIRGKNGKPDELNIYISLNIDDILDFSYFLIVLNNGEDWWFLTDEPDFANPEAKLLIAGRGATKYRERDYDKTIFPYIFLDRIEEWRKNDTRIDKGDKMKREMYTVPLTDWPVICRVMLNLLIEQVVNKLTEDNNPLPVMKFGYEYTSQLLIGNKGIKPDEWKDKYDFFDYAENNQNARKRTENLILKNEDEKYLVPLSTTDLANKLSVWNGSLMTEEKYRQLEAWAICDSEYQRRKKLLSNAEENRTEDEERMANMLDSNFRDRIESIFAAKQMYVFIYEPDIIYKGEHCCFNTNRGVILAHFHISAQKNFSIPSVNKTIGGETGMTCRKCNRHPLKRDHTSMLSIHHYSLLAWLAGVKREDLPQWFINYESHLYDCYSGNHLLNNINPVLQLKDSLSERKPNGITIPVRVCKRCRNAMNKRAMDKGVLVINKETCDSEGIFSLEEFRSWLKSKNIDSEPTMTCF